MITPRRIAALSLVICFSAFAQDAPPPAAAPATIPAIAEINHRFAGSTASARKTFQQSVAAARKIFDDAIAEAAQKRTLALQELQDSAMNDKNLDLAIATRQEIAKPFPVKVGAELPGSRQTAKIVIAATIDGSDLVTITQQSMTWKHRNWGLPMGITVNNIAWDLAKTPELPNNGDTKYLPFTADFSTARVLSRSGRDIAVLEKRDDSMTVVFSDTPEGYDDYTITIEVQAAYDGSK